MCYIFTLGLASQLGVNFIQHLNKINNFSIKIPAVEIKIKKCQIQLAMPSSFSSMLSQLLAVANQLFTVSFMFSLKKTRLPNKIPARIFFFLKSKVLLETNNFMKVAHNSSTWARLPVFKILTCFITKLGQVVINFMSFHDILALSWILNCAFWMTFLVFGLYKKCLLRGIFDDRSVQSTIFVPLKVSQTRSAKVDNIYRSFMDQST